eukprot:4248033-Alexandrium_andersonii.AAC.1
MSGDFDPDGPSSFWFARQPDMDLSAHVAFRRCRTVSTHGAPSTHPRPQRNSCHCISSRAFALYADMA